jgi:IPT/TIG domain
MLVLGGAAGAGASITVGQVAPTPASLQSCTTGPFDEAQKEISSGTSYTVPTAGVLTSWSTLSGIGGKLGLKVYRPALGGFQVVAVDGPQTLAPDSLNTFPVSIPVQPGDLVGITWPAGANTNCLFAPGNAGDVIMWSSGNQPAGGIASLSGTESNRRVNISANLLPPPLVTSISPAGGSIAGGTSVTIAGSNFASVSSVTFGGVPAGQLHGQLREPDYGGHAPIQRAGNRFGHRDHRGGPRPQRPGICLHGLHRAETEGQEPQSQQENDQKRRLPGGQSDQGQRRDRQIRQGLQTESETGHARRHRDSGQSHPEAPTPEIGRERELRTGPPAAALRR